MFRPKTPLTLPQILAWADDHRRRTGKYPHAKSGPVQAETWGGINQALAAGLRSLPGGDSLARLLRRERGRQESRGRRPEKYSEKTRLLHGPYHPPALPVGGKAVCLLKGDVVVTSWADALIPWPRCRPLDATGGRPSLLIDEELARAIRCESAAALMHWWSVGAGVLWKWRKALAVDRMNNPGSSRLALAAAQKGGRGRQGVDRRGTQGEAAAGPR